MAVSGEALSEARVGAGLLEGSKLLITGVLTQRSIAFTVAGQFVDTPPESALEAFRTSAYSLKALTAAMASLLEDGGSVVGLDFDARVAWPIYDWMGVSKAALEAVSRYLAAHLGPSGIRV